MAQKKGQTGNKTGRPKGVPNKSTNELRNIFQSLLEANLTTLQADLNKLDPKDRLSIIFKLAAFCLPTLQSQNISLDSTGSKTIRDILEQQR